MKPEKQLYQWDVNQYLTGINPAAQYVDYTIVNEVIRLETDGTRCRIPDEVLQTYGGKTCYERYPDGTFRAYSFTVLYAPKPPDYVYTPEERTTFEALTARVDAAIEDIKRRADSGEFTPKKGVDYFTNAEKAEMMESVSSGAVGEFRKVVDSATTEYNANAAEKLTTYDTNAEQQTAEFDSNASEKLKAYNDNHVEKMTVYDTNAAEKLSTYNSNAEQKLESYNQNHTAKVAEYNQNADNRVAEFDSHTEQIQTDINGLKSDLDYLAEIEYKILSKSSTELTKHGTRGYLNSKGTFVENSGYYLYYITMPMSGEIWFDEFTDWLRVAIYDGELFDTSALKGYYNKSNGDIPYETNRLFVSKGYKIAINVNTNNGVKYDFALHCPFEYVLSEKQKENVKNYIEAKKPKCIYRGLNSPDDNNIYYTDKIQVWNESTNKVNIGKVLSIYIPTKKGYVNYNFGKSWSGKDSSGNEIVGGYDVWRMCITYAVDDDLSKRFEITRGGEWEMACRIVGRDDFIGGYEHGDEYGQTVRVYIDGKLTDVESITELTEFTTLKVVCVSDMFDPNDHTTKVGIHAKEWLFEEDKATLTQSIQWLFTEQTNMTASYMAMFPAIRGKDSNSEYQITDSYYSDVDMNVEDCSTGDNTTEKHDSMVGDVNKVTLYSEKSGVHATVENLVYPKLEGNEVHVSGGVNRANKIYFTVCGGNANATIEPNAIWKSKTVYRLEIAEGTEIN